MVHAYCAAYGSIGIRPLHEEDIEMVRQWRNNKELSRFLTPVRTITLQMQKQWFERYLEDEDVVFFAVADLEREEIIGTVALYGFTGTSCEVGKIVIGNDSKRGRGIGYTSLLMAMCTGFAYMGIEKYRLRVCAENETAHGMYVKAGFRETGRHPFSESMTEIDMEITREEFAEANSMAGEIYLYMEGQPVSSKGGGKKHSKIGKNCVIAPDASIGCGSVINHNCVIEKDVVIGAGSYIDSNCILKSGTRIGDSAYIGAGCIIGEKQVVKKEDAFTSGHEILSVGREAVIRSGSVLYSGSSIGSCFQTGHRVTVREKSQLGHHVSVGTLSDIQGHCHIGNYVRLHSNVHIGQRSWLEDFVWMFPYAVLTNDPTPPSESLKGVHIASFAVIAAGAVILPGISVGRDALIGAGAVVTKDVRQYEAAAGNPAKVISDVRQIKDRDTGRDVYPWRYHFSRGMPWADCGYDAWEAAEKAQNGHTFI